MRHGVAGRGGRLATLCVALLAGACGIDCASAIRTAELLGDRDPRVLYRVDLDEPAVALTLDDGPDAGTTAQLLDVLARHGARATFFLIAGRLEGHEEVAARIEAEGHEVANHGAEDRPAIELGPEAFERQLLEAHAELVHVGGVARWYRPGSGWYEDWMLDILERHGYRAALGSNYALDAQIPFAGLATRAILWQVDPGDVIILHDGGERGGRTVEVLEVLLPELVRRGYRVVTLSELVELATSEGATP